MVTFRVILCDSGVGLARSGAVLGGWVWGGGSVRRACGGGGEKALVAIMVWCLCCTNGERRGRRRWEGAGA